MTAITHINDSGNTDRTITKCYIMDSSGTDRLVQKIIVRDSSGVDREVFIYFSATPNATYFYGSGSGASSSGGPINTAICTITVVGGSGSETFAWSLVSYNRGAWTATSPSTNATAFTVATAFAELAYNSTWKCTVVDGDITVEVIVDAAIDWFNTA